ncbi:protein of unknown function [Mariniphaga anaerophila]|uniref:DUF4998 domain-containing protein n=1 Tax=Mariniphaga anaerophila TaxID=1484053 RepID=A0A1M5FA99_9BACT|nr:DUF4998 domain-containing protein [Mariniphaga anaerophila]SHF87991.1 protein of unknown function [Mariniphaga anaerophila]
MNTKIIYFIVVLSMFSTLMSCEKMEDTYFEFVKDGETIYVGKADSVKTRGGNNRIELSWLLVSDPKVNSYKVYWNSRRDSIENTVTKTTAVDTVRVLLTDIREDVHNFEIFTYDKDGNSSVAVSTIGRVYGDNYKASLLQRTYKTINRSDDNLIVKWSEAPNTLLFVEIQYTDNMGNMVKKFVPGETEVDSLKNFPVGGSLQYRTAFLPEPEALDTFYTSFNTITEDDI